MSEIDRLKQENDCLKLRLRHLLESKYIRSFDEWDRSRNDYKRDIKEADKVVPVEVIETFEKIWKSRAITGKEHFSYKIENGLMASAAKIILEWFYIMNGGGDDAVS